MAAAAPPPFAAIRTRVRGAIGHRGVAAIFDLTFANQADGRVRDHGLVDEEGLSENDVPGGRASSPSRVTPELPTCPLARVKRRYGFRPPKLDGFGKAMPSSRMPSGECRASRKTGTAIQFQRRELVAVPVLRLTHRWTRKRPSRCFGWRTADRPVQDPRNARSAEVAGLFDHSLDTFTR